VFASGLVDTLKGKVVGFIDNAKPNFNHLADDIGELSGLETKLGERDEVSIVPAIAGGQALTPGELARA